MNFKIERRNKGLGFSNVLETLLKNRGVENPNKFLNLSDDVIEDYNNYDNINLAGSIVLDHLNKDNNIAILVDNDGDGFTSGALIYNYLKDIKPNIKLSYLIHTNKAHGLTNEIMCEIDKLDLKLIIIPDAASNDYDKHRDLYNKGIDVVVLDHHYASKYSEFACVVNNLMSKNIKNKAMTGVGVTYKFCKWIDNELSVNFADKYLDLVALGMIGDSADLKDLECRYLVNKGIDLIESQTNNNNFISKIYKSKSFSMNNKCTISGIAFYMCPTINCIIRGGDYETKVNLFKAFIGSDDIFKDKIRGKGEVELCIEDYMLRVYTKLKKQQDKIAEQGVELLSNQIEQYKLNENEIIVVNGHQIEDKTYNRLIVNKLSSKYNKHVLLLSQFEDSLAGSGTGMRNKGITDLRRWCELTGLFNYAEGHALAFGCSIPKYNIEKLYDLIRTIPSSDILLYTVDEIYNEKTLNSSIINVIGNYDYIWGNKLDEPIFAIEDIIIPSDDVQIIGKNKTTLKFKYKDIEFMKFKSSEEEYNEIIKNNNNKFTIVGKFKVNKYNGVATAQVLIEGYKFEKCDKSKFIF